MTIIVIWIVLSVSLIVWFLAIVNSIMQNWLYDFIVSGLNVLVELFWTSRTVLFLSLFTLAWMTLVIRFVMSWIGENPWHSANS